MAIQIASALDAAHRSRYFDQSGFERIGLLHGDIKPSNILIRPDGTPVLTDFMVIDIQRALDRRYRLNIRNVEGDFSTSAFGTPG
jgi:serine/threonine protein kinase